MMRTYSLDLDIKNEKYIKPFKIKQGDRLTNEVKIDIYHNDEPLDLEDKIIEVQYQINKKYIIQTQAENQRLLTVTGNQIKCIFKNEVSENSGNVYVEVIVRNQQHEEELRTHNFMFQVLPSII